MSGSQFVHVTDDPSGQTGEGTVVGSVHRHPSDRDDNCVVQFGLTATTSGFASDCTYEPANLRCQVTAPGVAFELTFGVMQPRTVPVVAGQICREFGQFEFGGGIDENAAQLIEGVVSGGAVDREHRIEWFRMAEDLFDHEPLIWSDQFSQAPEIFRRIRESVRMIDANAVDQSFVDPRLHLPMAEFEDVGVLLAQRSEFVDGKEPSVIDDPGVPRYESVRLPGVHLLWRSEFSTGSDGEAVLVEREKCFLAVFLDSQCVEIVRATQYRE